MAISGAGTVFLVDGSGFIFRAFHALPYLSNQRGLPTNALYGYLQMLLKLTKEYRPDYLAVAFDDSKRTFRDEVFPEYKANRKAPPEDLIPQFPYFRQLVEAFNIPALGVPGFEADDVIATLTRRARAQGLRVVIVSSDKDLMQLIEDDGSVVMLEQERWIAPLADEIHAALVDRLTKSLGPPAAGPAAAGSATSWRMTVDVRRFELVADREARLEADWWIGHGDTNVGCHSAFVQQPAAPGYAALAAAQQRAVGQLADAMSAALEELTKARPTGC